MDYTSEHKLNQNSVNYYNKHDANKNHYDIKEKVRSRLWGHELRGQGHHGDVHEAASNKRKYVACVVKNAVQKNAN